MEEYARLVTIAQQRLILPSSVPMERTPRQQDFQISRSVNRATEAKRARDPDSLVRTKIARRDSTANRERSRRRRRTACAPWSIFAPSVRRSLSTAKTAFITITRKPSRAIYVRLVSTVRTERCRSIVRKVVTVHSAPVTPCRPVRRDPSVRRWDLRTHRSVSRATPENIAKVSA